MHLDDEQLQRLLHQELGDSASRDHVSACTTCQARLQDARREEEWIESGLRRLDHGLPQVSFETVKRRGGRPARIGIRWAAGILIALGVGGVAYAAPGSPLPGVVRSVIHRFAPERPPQPATSLPATRAGSQAGIAVAPGSRMAVVFVGVSHDTAVISLSDSAELMVRALAGKASFSSEPERLTVTHQGSPARLELTIPRDAPLVEVWIDGRRVLLKEGSRLVTQARPDPDGSYRLPLGHQP